MANRYARIESDAVAEVVELPTGIKPADAFHASIASQFRTCSAEVMAGWLFDGETYTPPEVIEIVPITILPAVTLWERMTVEEASQVETVMATQPFRTRQIFLTANTFRSDHELWPLLVQIANQLFGEARDRTAQRGAIDMTAVIGVLLDELRGLLSVEHDGTITWDELQQLKNEHFGPDAVAIEVYPPHSHVVNSLPMRHLWKLGSGEYWPDLTGQKLVGDLTLRDREILTRSEIEFISGRQRCKISTEMDGSVVLAFGDAILRSGPDPLAKPQAPKRK